MGGELMNANLGPEISPPTNSATSNAAASKLAAITLKNPTLRL